MTETTLKKILVALLIVLSQTLYSQIKDRISFGLNIIHFNDWKNKPLNFFNPEIRYSKMLRPNSFIDIGLNAFYGQAAPNDFKDPGDVFQRLIFTTDVGFKKCYNQFSAVIGPTFRYRHEHIRATCTACPPWEFRIEPGKSFFDFGGIGGLNYEFFLKERSSFELKMAYRLYNKGVDPVSLGLYYNRQL